MKTMKLALVAAVGAFLFASNPALAADGAAAASNGGSLAGLGAGLAVEVVMGESREEGDRDFARLDGPTVGVDRQGQSLADLQLDGVRVRVAFL